MQPSTARPAPDQLPASESLVEQFSAVRRASLELCAPLEVEDHGVQPMPDASPPKWHLAHTSWFFETFILRERAPGYRVFDPNFEYLFNSYYNGVGAQFPRHRRGQMSRPSLAQVHGYRAHVDEAMVALLTAQGDDAQLREHTVLGLNHEQQHQELLLTDLKYAFGHNPLFPVYRSSPVAPPGTALSAAFVPQADGLATIGAQGSGFAFDNEHPAHQVLLQPYELANRLVTNGEYLAFVQDGGYGDPALWLASGWTRQQDAQWQAPLYWHQRDGDWFEYRLDGLAPLDLARPVLHVSAYEADAFARWRGARLPTEFEWEAATNRAVAAASASSVAGNFVDDGFLHSRPAAASAAEGELLQLFGDAWEWTMSSYGPYPGFQTLPGTLGEYNGKFMSEQLVLRGGSCLTPRGHVRSSYRNFFYPPDRWQATGIRLARDLPRSGSAA